MRDPRYDILFEPVKIGPLTAKNRFYQVPHCNGGGYRDPSAAAAMRGIKAEGGWGVIFTEQCEMHQTSEITPFIELRLWEDKDIPALRRMSEAMKTHGALAGIQLAYSGVNGPNFYTREVPLAPTALPIRTFTNDPVSARALTTKEIGDLRRWFVNAAKRSKAGRVRPDLPVRGAWFRHLPAFPQPRHQSAQRRVWRQPGKPLAVRARGRGRHPRCGGRHDGHHAAGEPRRDHWRAGLQQCGSARIHRDEPGPARPVGPGARYLGRLLGDLALQGRGSAGPTGEGHPGVVIADRW